MNATTRKKIIEYLEETPFLNICLIIVYSPGRIEVKYPSLGFDNIKHLVELCKKYNVEISIQPAGEFIQLLIF